MEIPTVPQIRRSWLQALAFLLLTAATSLGQNTSLTINSQPGDSIGGGASFTVTPAQGTFNAYNSGGVSVSVASPDHYLYMSFAAPASAPLTVGTYANAMRYPFESPDKSGLAISVDGSAPTTVNGSFVVKKIIYGGFGDIIAFWATFVQYSDGSTGALTGEIKFNADATGTPVNQPPGTYAGPNQRIPITSSATLSGIAGDDGLFNPTLTINWQAFGSGTVTFANANALQTTATFSAAGTYSLRLTVYDGEYYSSSDLVIDVYDPNAVTSLTMASEPGDYIGGGLSYSYTQTDGTFSASYSPDSESISVSFNSPDHWWNLSFAAPINAPLKVGTYSGATRAAFHAIGEPGLEVYGDGRSSNTLTGSFEVKKVICGPSGVLTSFWATFIQHSEGGAPALTGEIKFNAGATATPVNQRPGVYAGPDQRVSLAAGANLAGRTDDDGLPTSTLTTTWALVSGPGTVQFANAHALKTTATFSALGTYYLSLTSDDGALTNSDPITVTVFDPSAMTTLTMTSDPGDFVGGGLTYSYSVQDGDFTAYINYLGGVSVAFNTPGYEHSWYLDFAAPNGGPLTIGTYTGAGRFPFQIAGAPGLDVSGDGRGANSLTGSFEIKQLTYKPDGSVDRFWATFIQHSEGQPPALRGEIKLNAAPPVNMAPYVNAGEDRVVLAERPILLNGVVRDDGLPNDQTTATWTVIRGPGKTTFTPTNAAVTTVRFSTPGVYVLRLKGSDGVLNATDDVELTAVSSSDSYSAILPPTQFGGQPSAISVTLTRGVVTGTLESAGKRTSFKAVLDASGAAQIPLKIGTATTAQLKLQLQADPAALAITLAQNAFPASAVVPASEHAVSLATGLPSARAGFYNVVLSDPSLPAGTIQPFGYGSAQVTKSGFVHLMFQLPDRTMVTEHGVMAHDGSFALYDASRPGHGTTAGTVHFEDLPVSDLDGGLILTPPLNPTSPLQLSSTLQLIGSRYTAPAPGQRVLDFGNASPNGRFIANSSKWKAPLITPVTLTTKNVIIPQTQPANWNVKLGLQAGGFRGEFTDPVSKRRVPFNGVLLQKARAGYGAFFTKDGTGYISLVPLSSP